MDNAQLYLNENLPYFPPCMRISLAKLSLSLMMTYVSTFNSRLNNGHYNLDFSAINVFSDLY